MADPAPEPDTAAVHISGLALPKLAIQDFTASPGEFWCIYGSNRSGINTFAELICGEIVGAEAERLLLPVAPGVISFARQQEIFEDELRNDDSDFLDRPDPGTPARDFLPPPTLDSPLIDAFNLRPHLDTGYRQLSSGQSRKLLLLAALLGGKSSIIIDSLYDGLDHQGCLELDQAIASLRNQPVILMTFVRNPEDIPGWCTHLAILDDIGICHSGEKNEVLPLVDSANIGPKILSGNQDERPISIRGEKPATRELIKLSDGFASYGETRIFSGLHLSVHTGQHTLITGPNGCGKSTLLHIITGDNPKCYANDLEVFGIKRGSGESIWDIKRHMGIVSPELHRSYRVPGSCLQVVLSGFFDSIGIYDRVTGEQQKAARQWLGEIHMADRADTPFRALSYGEQRLVLIARALIKQPPLLVLDEPTQGLDRTDRLGLLDFLENSTTRSSSTILYVSHRQDEFRAFYRQHLELEKFAPKR